MTIGRGTTCALVTGAGGGIGTATVRALVEDGFFVYCGARDVERTARVLPAEGVDVVPLDVTDSRSVEAAIARAGRDGLDVIVNNAGRNVAKRFVDTEESLWWELIDVNLVGPLRVLKAAFPALRERGGCVVNIGSESGTAGSAGEVPYSAAKAGVSAATRALAREWARFGIRVNAVAPGPIDTDMLLDLVHGDKEAHMVRTEKFVRLVPLRRLGRPEEIAAAVKFLVSPGAGFMTGQTLHVGGGVTMLP